MNALAVLFSFLVLAVLAFPLTLGKHYNSFAGPWVASVSKFDNISDEYTSTEDMWGKLYFTASKPKQLQYTWGRCFIGIDMTDELRAQVRISKRSNNQWKKNAFVMNFNRACTNMMKHARFLANIAGYQAKCPAKKFGFRAIRNQTFDPVFPNFPIAQYGHWQATLAIIDIGDKTVGVFVAEVNVSPKL